MLSLSVDNLACRRGEKTVFTGLTFQVNAGEAMAVTGANGAGKSSLLAILSGRLPAAGGAIALEGAGERDVLECLHLVGHRDGLKSALTARENLKFAQKLLGNSGLSPLDALDRVNLVHAADIPVAYLSAGQRRRVALARLLVTQRPIWLLDEPASALDKAAHASLGLLMEEHLKGGGLIVAATHESLHIESRVIRLERPVSDMRAETV